MHLECNLVGSDLLQFDELSVVRRGFGKGLADSLPRDVFDAYRTIMLTEQPGNPAPHDAGSKHRRTVDRLGRDVRGYPRLLLEQLIGMKQADQVLTNRGRGQQGKCARFLSKARGELFAASRLHQP